MKILNRPAAVNFKPNMFANYLNRHCDAVMQNGKAAKHGSKSEDLPKQST